MTADARVTTAAYAEILEEYLRTRSEGALYRASILSHVCIEQALGPEDIVGLHTEALQRLQANFTYRQQARAAGDGHQFLLEVMISYGIQYREYLDLRLGERARDAEAEATLAEQRAQDAERSEQEKIEILRVIVHELNTPITAAKGTLELAARQASKGRLDGMPRFVDRALVAVERMQRLVENLSEASRGVAPHLDLSLQDLAGLVVQAHALAGPAASERHIQLDPVAGAGGSLPVRGNAGALLSVAGNLLSNAIRYTPEHGHVSVSVGRGGPDAGQAVVEVRDSGIGMSPEVRARIFERFYRAPEAQRRAAGLGVGLALVQQLVEAHSGQIEVESAPGVGSTFRVSLPIADPTKETTYDDQRAASNGHRPPKQEEQ